MQTEFQKSLLGTNFYAVLILLITSFFGGMSEDLATQIAGVVSGIIGAAYGVRNWYKNAKLVNGKAWIADPNNWTYLSAVVFAIIPKAGDLVPALRDLIQAVIAGNWGSIITAGVSLLTLVYYIFVKGKMKPGAAMFAFAMIVPALCLASCEKAKPSEQPRQAISLDVKPEIIDQMHICKQIETRAGKSSRAVGSFGRYWTGKEPAVTVRFIGKNPTRESHFKQAASDWSASCGLKFNYVTTGKADIRVMFNDGDGAWSYIGTDAKKVSGTTTPTLNVGWDGYDVAAHEIGHAIGLQHEQSNPNKGICWNEQAVIKALSGPPNSWSIEEIKFNVFQKADPATVNATQWDEYSIMQYNIPSSWTCDGRSIPGGKVISEKDRSFIASAYPKATQPTITITQEQRQRLLNAADEIKTVLQ